jgi:S1-C subfamily serine protease
MSKSKKIFRWLGAILVLVILSSALAVFLSLYLLPIVKNNPLFSKWKFINQSGEEVTVINKTEQVMVSSGEALEKIASSASRSTVNIISVPTREKSSASSTFITPKNGTGVILTSDGIIAAERQAIDEKAEKYTVLIFDGSQLPATFIGIDNFTDLAFFKVDSSNLPAISLSTSDNCQPGGNLVIVKNDGSGFANSFFERSIKYFDQYFNLAGKTVASSEKLEGVCRIHPANQDNISGIAINEKGEMVGIVSGNELNGIMNNYYISSDEIKRAMKKISDGKIIRSFFGAYYLSINPSLVIANDLPSDSGALIYSPSGQQGLAVLSGSPAAKSGIRVGDIILSVNDITVNNNNPLSDILSDLKPGDQISLKILRSGSEMDLTVTLE